MFSHLANEFGLQNTTSSALPFLKFLFLLKGNKEEVKITLLKVALNL